MSIRSTGLYVSTLSPDTVSLNVCNINLSTNVLTFGDNIALGTASISLTTNTVDIDFRVFPPETFFFDF